MPAARVSRRTAFRGAATLGGTGLVVGLLGACDDASVDPTPASAGATTAAAAPSADDLLVDRAVERIGAAAATVALTVRRHPGTASQLAPLRAMHAAHRRALGVTVPPPAPLPLPPGPPSRRRALASIVAAEEELSSQLAYLASGSESGELARLLASMAASVHEHVLGLTGAQATATGTSALPRAARRPAADVEFLQRALAAEHAAVYVYGVLGAQTSQTDPATASLFARLTEAYGAHLARREDLVAVLAAAGTAPVAAAPAYDVPVRLDRRRVVGRTAGALEAACAAEYAFGVARTTGATRRWAIATLRSTSVRGLAFRGTPETFPGAGEYADR